MKEEIEKLKLKYEANQKQIQAELEKAENILERKNDIK